MSAAARQGSGLSLPITGVVGELITAPILPQPPHALMQPVPKPALTVVLKSKLWSGKLYPLDLSPITSIRDAMEELKRKLQHEHSISPERSITLQLCSSLLLTGLVTENKPIKALGANPVLQCQIDISCLACNKSKAVDRFIDPATRKLQDLCAKCRKAAKDGSLTPSQWCGPISDSKRCSSCKTHKPLDSFHTAYSVCFECLQKKRQRYSIQKHLMAAKKPGRQVEVSGEEVSFDNEERFQEWLQQLQETQGYKLRLHYDRPGGGVDKHAAGHHPKDAATWIVRQTALRGDASFRTRLYKCPCRHILKCVYHINVRTAVDHDSAKPGRVFATPASSHNPKCAVVAREMARLAREGGEIQLQFDNIVPPGPKRRLFAADVRGEARKARKNGMAGSNKRAKVSKAGSGDGAVSNQEDATPSRPAKSTRWANDPNAGTNQARSRPSPTSAANSNPLLGGSDTEYMLEGWGREERDEQDSDGMEELGEGGFTPGKSVRVGRMYQQLDSRQQQGYDLSGDGMQLRASNPAPLSDHTMNANEPMMQHMSNQPNASNSRRASSQYPSSANPSSAIPLSSQQHAMVTIHPQHHERGDSPALQAITQPQPQTQVQPMSQVPMPHSSYPIPGQDPTSITAMHPHATMPIATAYGYNQAAAAAAAAATMAQYGGMQWAAPATAVGQPLHSMSTQDLNQHFQGVLMTAAAMPTAEKLAMLQQWMQTLQMEVAAATPSAEAQHQQQAARHAASQQHMVSSMQQQMNHHMQHMLSKQTGATPAGAAAIAAARKHKKGGNAMPCI